MLGRYHGWGGDLAPIECVAVILTKVGADRRGIAAAAVAPAWAVQSRAKRLARAYPGLDGNVQGHTKENRRLCCRPFPISENPTPF